MAVTMGKRKRRQSGELPLFDLPLRDEAAEREAGPGVAETPRGPSILFDEPTSDDDEAELDRLGFDRDAGPEPEAAATGPEEEARADDAGSDDTESVEPALVGDRLLGGLADLAVQLLMLGLAIAACHSMGIALTFADWPPFAVLATVFSFLYWVVPLAFWGQTPGMAWVGHTARAESGEPLAFSQTLRRWLGAALTLALAGLPLLLALAGRSLTDRLSGSRTVSD